MVQAALRETHEEVGIPPQSVAIVGYLPPMPTVDALAANGVRFLNAYAAPVCSPTRAAMLTGRYAYRTGVSTVVGGATGPGLSAGPGLFLEAARPGA